MSSYKVLKSRTEGHLAAYTETLAILIEHYDTELFPIKESPGIDMIRFLAPSGKKPKYIH